MRSALEQAHGGIYRYTSKAEMDRTFDRAFRRIDRPMTDLEFWRLIAPVVAHIKCGHTYIWFPNTLQTQFETNTPFFPLAVRVLGKRAYVYQDCANAGSGFEGAELLSINGRPMKSILEQLRSVITGDGNTSTAKDYRIGHNGGFTVYLYALGIQSPFHATCRGKDKKRLSAELAGMTIPQRTKAWEARNSKPDANAELTFRDDGNIAVLSIRHWNQYADPKRKLPFVDFLQQSFAQIKKEGSSNLIIDVRDNAGGLDPLGKHLFSFLWNKPFYYYSDLTLNAREFDYFKYAADAKPVPADRAERQADGKFHMVKHPNWGLQQPSQPHFSGRVFALMNGGSFSASCEFLSVLHFHKRGKLIGEETAGGYYGNTSGRTDEVTLPNSKLVLNVGIVTYYVAVSRYKYRDRGVLPDYPVSYTLAELMAGKDKEMELALSLITTR